MLLPELMIGPVFSFAWGGCVLLSSKSISIFVLLIALFAFFTIWGSVIGHLVGEDKKCFFF